jgi:hypothetical protein
MDSSDNTQFSLRADRRSPVLLACVECHAQSDPEAVAWRGYRIDEPATDEAPLLAFYCPACSVEHFG